MFNTAYQEFIYKRTYSRWLDDQNRRETWDETVDRYRDFFLHKLPDESGCRNAYSAAIASIRELEVMPSMRALWSAIALGREPADFGVNP